MLLLKLLPLWLVLGTRGNPLVKKPMAVGRRTTCGIFLGENEGKRILGLCVCACCLFPHLRNIYLHIIYVQGMEPCSGWALGRRTPRHRPGLALLEMVPAQLFQCILLYGYSFCHDTVEHTRIVLYKKYFKC